MTDDGSGKKTDESNGLHPHKDADSSNVPKTPSTHIDEDRFTDNLLVNPATLVFPPVTPELERAGTPRRRLSEEPVSPPQGSPTPVAGIEASVSPEKLGSTYENVLGYTSPTQGLRSTTLDHAELANVLSAKTNYFPGMAKKPSTSSLDRSDIVDFVVDDRTPEETKAIYNSWAANYEEDMTAQKYKAPTIIAQFISQELKVPKTAVILDVGCGTGLLGVQMKGLGYQTMDGMDYSDEMLAEAKKKAIYKKHFLEKVAKGFKLPVKDGELCLVTAGEYDVVVMCGCLMPGHIMPDALPELARLVKPGGYLTWIHRTLDHYEHKSEQFLETRFTGTLHALCKQQRMDLVVRKKVQDYRLKSDGQIFALKKK